MHIAEVAFPVPVHNTYHYRVPDDFPSLAAGTRVRATFGPRLLTGTVLSVFEGEPGRTLKPLACVVDAAPVLSAEMLECARWMSRRYGAAIGECVRCLLPPFIRPAAPSGERRTACASEGGSSQAPEPAFELTEGQRESVTALLERMRSREHEVAVLFGVPASGKTEVYLRLLREAVQGGGQALFMLPEISLTGPFFEEFSARLGVPVVLWHSKLGSGERRQAWSGLASGSVQVVVGARSAALLPFRDLRLVVVDEEQDESFKQESPPPYYHAREVVVQRGKSHNALVILGSATPSLETCQLAAVGGARLLVMRERVCCKETPAVSVCPKPAGELCLSKTLVEKLRERRERGEQSILLVNRRGFSTLVMCGKCGWVDRCPSCGVARIRHQEPDGGFLMRCHHCGRGSKVAAVCALCSNPALWVAGTGTQKVVTELKEALPGVKALRMDRDTLKETSADRKILSDFRSGKAEVLVGTKLVAKSFHFPSVTLVGVVDADTMMHMPDFRASERTMQLLMQVAGRSGRGDKPGEVVIQTSHPALTALGSARFCDYEEFVRGELAVRKELAYPPFSALIRVELSGRVEKAVEEAGQAMAEGFAGALDPAGHQVLGPAVGIPPVLRGRHRRQLIVKVLDPSRAEAALGGIRRVRAPSGIKVKVVVDPYDLL
ncbi:MAG: primosomal protein N' [Elusimicrobia bacterium]|nr:primosomal protein N' [Elusimicrobiota bacterium]